MYLIVLHHCQWPYASLLWRNWSSLKMCGSREYSTVFCITATGGAHIVHFKISHVWVSKQQLLYPARTALWRSSQSRAERSALSKVASMTVLANEAPRTPPPFVSLHFLFCGRECFQPAVCEITYHFNPISPLKLDRKRRKHLFASIRKWSLSSVTEETRQPTLDLLLLSSLFCRLLKSITIIAFQTGFPGL